jgi:hypothetical protein
MVQDRDRFSRWSVESKASAWRIGLSFALGPKIVQRLVCQEVREFFIRNSDAEMSGSGIGVKLFLRMTKR